jgi:hypothetical protein
MVTDTVERLWAAFSCVPNMHRETPHSTPSMWVDLRVTSEAAVQLIEFAGEFIGL